MRNSRFFAQLADSYRREGDLDRAIELLVRGLERNPDYLTARIILARCYRDRGDLDQALEEYDRILDLDPFHTSALREKIEVLLGTGNLEAARRSAEVYFDEEPDDEEMRSLIREAGEPGGVPGVHRPVDEPREWEEERVAEELIEEEAGAPLPDEASSIEPAAAGEDTVREELPEAPAEEPEAADQAVVDGSADVVPDEREPAATGSDETAPGEAEVVEGPPGTGTVADESGTAAVFPEPSIGRGESLDPESELIATMTLAEIYASQGFYDKAIEIYQRIISREPGNEEARVRIGELQRSHAGEVDGGEGTRPDSPGSGGAGLHGSAPAGEIVTDEEYRKFRKWLRTLTKKRDEEDTSGNGEEYELGDDG
jgi:tetratricopeptide (TPR) repeat protein